ncbi:patatin-like phospholipase family protein [Roseicyclus persicicus]|uniref:Cyclic nucleotide-binding domain-containing protein n=1 Tax=Roseicyclus persicicus TaxID=2650661 RepID=A0A7X6GXC3_9RHOB|nr:patatin-like phospholipase family protein [Roseibacterium persicicum]NKX44124.1 cyclic nucleotide-binding domain-containing protein [Roseibacterium persicicum]
MGSSEAVAPQGLFAILQASALEGLEQERVGRGTRLIEAGTAADAMYLVQTGRFRVERDGVELAEIGAGSVMGEIAFFTGGLRTADVIAARDSVVYRLTRAEYEARCAEAPGLARAIAAELAQRLAATSARVPRDPGRPPARTFCVLPAAGAPLSARFVPALAEAIGRHHAVAVVGEAEFRAALGPGADPAGAEAVAWLNDQERRAGVVLFVAGPEPTPWSMAALRQADEALFVAQAVSFAPPSELERMALGMLPEHQRRLVLLHPHRMQKATGTGRWLDSRPVALHHHVALTADGADMARLGRFLAGRAIGMVLSGGGAFGVAHVGVWRAMEEAGLPVDIVGGTSVGSAMAGAMALGVPALEIGPRVEQIFVKSGAMRRVTVPKYAFLDHKVLDAALQEHYGDGPIEDLWLPFYAVAADLSTMTRRTLRRGPLWEAVRASSAIPGILPPFFTSEGGMLVDGGCIDNMPFRDMHGLKTGPNVVVNVQKDTSAPVHVDYDSLPGRAELLKRTVLPFGKRAPRAPGVISTVMRSLLVGQGATHRGLNADDLHVRPPGLKGAGFLAWSQHRLFYELSYRHAQEEVFADLPTSQDPAKAALRRAAGL